MIVWVCTCPYCRALVADDRPPAHTVADMPTVRDLMDMATTRKTAAMEALPPRRVARRTPVNFGRILPPLAT